MAPIDLVLTADRNKAEVQDQEVRMEVRIVLPDPVMEM